ncbi:hypothetical protein SAMN04487849_11629 [Micrococcus luteus]|uniref:Uncharacterized protein n=2 Tax=Micrococcus TaxID=1269 RepID=A0ABD7MAD0_MICLU|nr:MULTISPECIES: hypothetical protein [Micrococcus]MBF0744067.1 hypothetical protein [Micrococcus yunnanensis]TFU56048.1 hypothetical protein E4T95_01150 [Micrococcus yunnanensis]SHL86934.1 hypothetical protein SAMN04487849_11629 [Micrococcus luteus]STY73572.1 Uncharacterised protein [Micrococcus luteus]
MTRLLSGDSFTLDLAPEDPADLLARLCAVGVEMNVSAEQLIGDESGVHRGLYRRVVDHVPWLRGFVCDDLHNFGPEDRWILAR